MTQQCWEVGERALKSLTAVAPTIVLSKRRGTVFSLSLPLLLTPTTTLQASLLSVDSTTVQVYQVVSASDLYILAFWTE